MFDIGWTELLVIAVVAILVVGPKDLPGMLRTLGRYAGKLRQTAGEFRTHFDDALRESELDDIRSTIGEVDKLNPISRIRDAVTESLDPLKDAAGGMTGKGSGGSDVSETAAKPKRPAATKAKAADKPASRPARKPASAKPRARRTKTAAAKAEPAKHGN